MNQYAMLAKDTNSSSIGEIWSKIISPKSRWIADGAIFSLCFGCCVFYSAFIGDIFSALSSAVGITGFLGQRHVILCLISAAVLTPLCQLDDISALAFSSILGVSGIFYTLFFHILRWLDRTYAKGGRFFVQLAQKSRPTVASYTLWKVNKETLVLMNMLCVAYLAQYNAINYYKELENTSPQRYTYAISIGFAISILTFATMMFVGYNLFGATAQPLILNNFHRTNDILATFARFATGLAITFAYPLMFAGLKTSLRNLLPAPTLAIKTGPTTTTIVVATKTSDLWFKRGAIPLVLALITGIAVKCSEEDVSVVLGLVGSVLGCSVAYILPAFLKLKQVYAVAAVKDSQSGKSGSRSVVGIKDVWSQYALIALGLVCGGLGVWVTAVEASAGGHH